MRLNYETHKVHGNDDYEQMYLKSELQRCTKGT